MEEWRAGGRGGGGGGGGGQLSVAFTPVTVFAFV